MQNNTILTRTFAMFFVLALFIAPRISYADWGDHHHDDHHSYRWHDHPHYGLHFHYLPDGYFTVWVGGVRCYYYEGLYYSYAGYGDYVLVSPPSGAVVATIPSDFQPVFINGATYYVSNGVYYTYTPHGYRVVTQPAVTAVQLAPVVPVQPAAAVTATPAVVDTQDTFSVNVPNDKGGYTSVVIKKSGNDFVGPQGEFYAEFPKVAQLKVMYGK